MGIGSLTNKLVRKINVRTDLSAEVDPRDPVAVTGVLKNVTDALRRFNGDGQDPRERVITVGELEQPLAGLGITVGADGAFTMPEVYLGDSISVATPSGLSASGVFEMVILSWTNNTTGGGQSHVEVWRAESDNLSVATIRGRAIGATFADDARPDTTYYYWIRAVSASGNVSPFNDTNGTVGQTSLSPSLVLDQIVARAWSPTTAYRLFEVVSPRDGGGNFYVNGNGVPLSYQVTVGGTTGATEPTWPTTLGSTVVDNGVTWTAIDAGSAPFVIGTRNGDPVVVMPGVFIEDASIETAKIKSLAAEKIDAGTVNVALTLNAASILGGNLNINNKFVVDANGNTTIVSATSGARMEIANNVIKVYDGAGTKRVQLGDLTA